MIGQKHLLKRIDKMINEDSFPHFIILEGLSGSGRTTVSEYVGNQLGAEIKIIEELKIANAREVIEDAKALSFRKLYLFRNVEGMNIQTENALLKLVEEPTENCYVIMTVENISSLLPTIQSRAIVLRMDSYTEDELRQLTSREDLLSICQTPGMIKLFESCDADDTLKFSEKILKNVGRVSLMNMLTIITYIDLDGKDEDKYNANLILKSLGVKVFEEMVATNNRDYLVIAKKIQETRRALTNPSTNKQGAFDNLLFTMRGVFKDGSRGI